MANPVSGDFGSLLSKIGFEEVKKGPPTLR